MANATLWNTLHSQYNAIDDNNTHYTNPNCTNTGNGVNYTVNYMCNFTVYYYAENGTWNCSVNVTDTYNETGISSGSTVFYPVYALNVTDGLDFGNVGVGDFSDNKSANFTNFGNMAINISVEGYGVARGDGLAMNCSLGGNITVGNIRYSPTDVDWSLKTNLTSNLAPIANITILKQTNPGIQMTNTSYFQLYIDGTNNPGGNCSGFITFSAQAS